MTSLGETKKAVKEALAMMDWKGLARAFHEGNIQWHAKEWEDFVNEQRAAGAAAEKARIIEMINKQETVGNDQMTRGGRSFKTWLLAELETEERV